MDFQMYIIFTNRLTFRIKNIMIYIIVLFNGCSKHARNLQKKNRTDFHTISRHHKFLNPFLSLTIRPAARLQRDLKQKRNNFTD